ncbi:hypothetical protein DL764_009633 [Monosporascus ibericus]|uniref:Uncharacterized protein n=1 Tax=Monosporascus ibericus TaxID=155417 RepID=A0A4Q4SWJ9_9PEZI|nr:hypothetical protein DL764_009633 [Monosporascus ibericus]
MMSAPLPKPGLPETGRAYDGGDKKCSLRDQHALEDGTLLWSGDRSPSSGLRTAACMICELLALGLFLALHRHGLAKYQARIMARTFEGEHFVGWT